MQLYPKLILDALAKVRYPGNGKDLVANEMIEDDIRIDGNKVSFSIIFDKPTDPFIRSVVKAAETAILTFVSPEVNIKGNIAVKARQTARPNPENPLPDVKNIIAVSSAKGGVGKSTVTALIARRLASMGYSVGIMDADVTGPSVPAMFGIHGKVLSDENGIYPMVSQEGIKIISMNLLLDSEETPVIYRGPVVASIIKQFYSDVIWGNLDYLLIDMPPGTGDVPLTVYQSIPIDGVVMVTSPQNLVKMIVMKAVNMASKMSVPLLGIIENYSYFKCEDCGRIYEIFGKSTAEKLAKELNTTVIARIPIIPEVAQCEDKGIPVTQDIDMDLSNLL